MRTEFIKLVNELVGYEKEQNPNFESKGNINKILIAYYEIETGCKIFKTFNGWLEAGKVVKKGEKGHPIFSRPLGKIKEEAGKEATAEDFTFFGTCYLFTENQVQDSGREPIEVTAGKIEIKEFSEGKAIAVGDTKPVKEILKSCGAFWSGKNQGWIFNINKLETIKLKLQEHGK